jgi:5-methylcytosine-specific restriction endonuclease McrA
MKASDKNIKKFIRNLQREIELDEVELQPLNKEKKFIEVALDPYSEKAKTNCYICGKEFGDRETNLDHVIPKSRNDLKKKAGNLVKTHKQCNSFKSSRLPIIPKQPI